jgi:hypothetical protein
MGFQSERIEQTGTDNGLGLPVVTTTERDAIVGMAIGDVVYNSTTDLLNVYDGATWEAVGGASAKSAFQARLSASQTFNLAIGDHIEFNTTVSSAGSGISLATGSGQDNGIFTLSAGTYIMQSWVNINMDNPSDYVAIQWYNRDATAFVGVPARQNPDDNGRDTTSYGNIPVVIVTVASDTDFDLRIVAITGGLNGFLADNFDNYLLTQCLIYQL